VRRFFKSLITIYKSLLEEMASLGVEEVQIHEAVLVMEDAELLPLFQKAYPAILPKGSNLAFNMVSFMEDVGKVHCQWLCSVDQLSILSMLFGS
jgi:hypothetical protein